MSFRNRNRQRLCPKMPLTPFLVHYTVFEVVSESIGDIIECTYLIKSCIVIMSVKPMHTQKSTLNCTRRVSEYIHAFHQKMASMAHMAESMSEFHFCFHSNLQGDHINGVMGTGVDFGYTQRLSSAFE